nr:IclR family transcriptional regulator [arsenite-oxidising bacterium NT-25]
MSQTFGKGLKVLEALAHSSEPRGLSDLARSLGMNQSAVQRHLNTLVAAGYAEQPRGSRKYQLTVSLWELGMRSIVDNSARRLLRPTLRLGSQATRYTCFFARLAFPFVIYFERVEGVRSPPHSAELGTKIPLTSTASGKAILAYLPQTMRQALTQDATDWSGYVPYKGVSPDVIDAITQEVRHNRYAVSQGGLRKGRNSVAAPVWADGPLPFGSIVLTAGQDELPPDAFASVGAKVLELAEEATISLGGTAFRNAAELTPV